MAMISVAGQQYFQAYDPKYRFKCCCCCTPHVKTGAKVAGILMAIGIVMSLLQLTKTHGDGGVTSVSVIQIVIQGAVCISLFYGLHVERTSFLVPYLIYTMLGIIVLSIFALACVVFAIVNPQFIREFIMAQAKTTMDQQNIAAASDFDSIMRAVWICCFIIISIVVFIEIWFYWIVYRCYKFFREQLAFQLGHVGTGGNSTTQIALQMPPGHYQPTAPPGYYQPTAPPSENAQQKF